MVGVTTAADATRVRRTGAQPQVVRRSLAELDRARATLDRAAGRPARPCTPGMSTRRATASWSRPPTPPRPSVRRGHRHRRRGPSGRRRAAVPPGRTTSAAATSTCINSNTLCSVGFAVAGGFVTAGHCGGAGSPTWAQQRRAGHLPGLVVPRQRLRLGADQRLLDPAALGQQLRRRQRARWPARSEAAVGSSVCRSGSHHRLALRHHPAAATPPSTTPRAPVSGLTRSNVCAEPGDSGGSCISGNQAQGVTSGGSGNCTSGGTTCFQPVNEILGAYGLSLTTTGGGSGGQLVISSLNNKCIDVPNWNFSTASGCSCGAATAPTRTLDLRRTAPLRTRNTSAWTWPGARPPTAPPIQIASCSGNPAQQFVLSGAGDLVNPQANKCVDIGAERRTTAPGCTSGTAPAAPTRSGGAAERPGRGAGDMPGSPAPRAVGAAG